MSKQQSGNLLHYPSNQQTTSKHGKAKLVFSCLQKISHRLASIFFSKLFLYCLEQSSFSSDSHIRHYDLQCEAVQAMANVFETKLRAIQLKSFYTIKAYSEESPKEKQYRGQRDRSATERKMKNYRGYAKSNVDNYSYSYEPSFSNYSRNALSTANIFGNGFKTDRNENYRTTINKNKTNRQSNYNPQLNELDKSIGLLMAKVKILSDKFKKKSQKYSQCKVNRVITSGQKSRNDVKRKIILSKLAELQNDLSNFLQDEKQSGQENQIHIKNKIKIKKPQFFTQTKKKYEKNVELNLSSPQSKVAIDNPMRYHSYINNKSYKYKINENQNKADKMIGHSVEAGEPSNANVNRKLF